MQVGVHCSAHRLELAFKNAMKVSPWHTKMSTLLTGLYLFYHYSPLNRDDIDGLTGLKFKDEGLSTTRNQLLPALVNCLDDRFSEADDGVIGACQVADFKTWPAQVSDDEDFGDEDIKTLLDHFQPVLEKAGVNVCTAEEEWATLKTSIYKIFKDVKDVTWMKVNDRCKDSTNILAVIDLVLTLPCHSADAERGFSEMKMVKTDWRSCLQPSVLSELLFVLFNTPDISEFDPSHAIELWNSSGQRVRRPDTLPYGSRTAMMMTLML